MSTASISLETLCHALIDRLIEMAAMHRTGAIHKQALTEWAEAKFGGLSQDEALAAQRERISQWLESTAAECEGSARIALDAAALLLRNGVPA